LRKGKEKGKSQRQIVHVQRGRREKGKGPYVKKVLGRGGEGKKKRKALREILFCPQTL